MLNVNQLMGTRPVVLATLLAGLMSGVVPTARAQAPGDVACQVFDRQTGACLITVTAPAASPTPSASTPAEPGAMQGKPPACQRGGAAVACSASAGSWSNDLQCYLRMASPPPSADDPAWGGRFPTGAVYLCDRSVAGLVPAALNVTLVWLPVPPSAPTLSPEQAAQIVVKRLPLRAVDIGTAPEGGPQNLGLVGLPVWLWTSPTPQTFGPLAETASAGGVTITATARVDHVLWSMGDGATVTCSAPGTPYEPRYGASPSPDCGYRYRRTSRNVAAGAYTVTAKSHWSIAWRGGGRSGTIPLELESSTSLSIGEAQLLVERKEPMS